jgi:hypothetical protein
MDYNHVEQKQSQNKIYDLIEQRRQNSRNGVAIKAFHRYHRDACADLLAANKDVSIQNCS